MESHCLGRRDVFNSAFEPSSRDVRFSPNLNNESLFVLPSFH
jgi:hypothetical protein